MRTTKVAAIAALLAFQPSQALAQYSVSISGSDIVAFTDRIGQAIAYLVEKFENSQTAREKQSVAELVRETAILAGREEALANALQPFALNSARGRTNSNSQAAQDIEALNDILSEIEVSMTLIKKICTRLDPQWVAFNPLPVADLGSFASDGVLFYFLRGQMLPLNDPAATGKLIANVRAEAAKLRSLAQKIGATQKH